MDTPNGVTVSRLPPVLLQQMSEEWVEQTLEWKESQAHAIYDQTV